MAKGNRVQHWKHGWIPVSPEAKAYLAHKGPKPVTGKRRAALPMPGDPDYSPNNEFGLRSKHMADERPEAMRRVNDIKEIFPGVDPQPHHQFASQSMPAYWTGGVVLSADDTDKILDELENNHEGTASRLDAAQASGMVGSNAHRLTTNTAKGNKEEQARRRARRLTNYLGMEFGPHPEYVKVDASASLGGRLSVKSGHTGGLVFDGPTADEFIRKANQRVVSGQVTAYQVGRASGTRRF